MLDASAGFVKDGNKNRLRAQDIYKIVDVFNSQEEISGYSRMVPTEEIANSPNEYNLNIPRYIDASQPEDIHDLDAHLNGGIPDRDIDDLDAYWRVFPRACRQNRNKMVDYFGECECVELRYGGSASASRPFGQGLGTIETLLAWWSRQKGASSPG